MKTHTPQQNNACEEKNKSGTQKSVDANNHFGISDGGGFPEKW
jgi:hypothetical protein